MQTVDMRDLFEDEDILMPKPRPHHKTLRRQTALTEIDAHDEYRRAYGVQQLIKVMGVGRPKEGKSYHIISGGNVDLLSHLRWLLCHWKQIDHLFISAWAISSTDILLLERWAERGQLRDISLVVGDIFPRKYVKEWEKLEEMRERGIISRIFSEKIHSKLMLMEASDGTKIVLESSANCKMNPRVEQSIITVSDKLHDFYQEYFHEMFNRTLEKKIVSDLNTFELNTEEDDSDFFEE